MRDRDATNPALPLKGGGENSASCSQYRNLAAVEIDGGAVQPAGARRDREYHEAADVFDRADANRTIEFAQQLFANFLLRRPGALDLGLDAPPRPVGLDDAGMDAVYAHAIGLAAIGEAFAEGGNGGIDRAADREFGGGLASAGAADRDERPAPLLEQRPGGAGEPDMGEEFQRVTVFPIGVGETQEIAALGGAGIVDQNIERAKLAFGLRDQLRWRVLLAQI